jgi:putative redox protein
MKINLELQNDKYHLKAINEEQKIVDIDGSPQIGGQNLAMRPMQLMLSALGSCASMDILSILRKQKQTIKSYKVKVAGEREKGKVPSLFTNIHLHFEIAGQIEKSKIERAIDLSLTTYCSVAKTLEQTTKITHSYTIFEI